MINIQGMMILKYDIYEILCEGNGKRYFGRSQETEKRWRAHRNMLRKNSHRNMNLQEDWNVYGEEMFKFSILESFSELSDSISKEQELIDSNIGIGYNIGGATDGGDRMRFNPRREETLRLKSKVFSGEGNPMFGRPKTEKMINRVKEANSKSVSIEGVIYPSVAEAVRTLGIGRSKAYQRVRSKNFPDWFYVNDKSLTTIPKGSRE
jgi:group I intron endonuclease